MKSPTVKGGIPHLEDLPTDEFISTLRNIGKFVATEKLDGANLWFGLDESGELFTSRGGKRKNSDRFYSPESAPESGAINGFKGAFMALLAKESEIKTALKPGDTIEIEVLYGRQPNAVTYGAGGKNFIAFIRGVLGTSETAVTQIKNALENAQVIVNTDIIDTDDGKTLNTINKDLTFQFITIQQIDSKKLESINVEPQLKKLEAFLNLPCDIKSLSLSNGELLSASLGSIDKETREEAKTEKANISGKVLTLFKLPIKRLMLDSFVKKLKPLLSADDIDDNEDLGIEGVVLRNTEDNTQIKLVDKEGFTTINQFNYAVRSQISGPIKNTDLDTPLDAHGGILGELKIKIADLFGDKDLARPAQGKKIFLAVNGSSPKDTMRRVIDGFVGKDSFIPMKRKILALISETDRQLNAALDSFNNEHENYQLSLKTGKTIGLSPAVVKRTLMGFALAKKNVMSMAQKVNASRNFSQLSVVFWGKYAVAIHQAPDEVVEVSESYVDNLLTEKKFQTNKSQFKGKDAFSLINIYFASLFLTAIMYKSEDKIGMKMCRDKSNYRMTHITPIMSPLNFWGYPVWRSASPAVKKIIGIKASKELSDVIKKIPKNYRRFLHLDLSGGIAGPINWNDHYKTLKMLQWFPGMKTDRINKILIGIFKFEELTQDQQIKVLNLLYYYTNQFIPHSPLIPRLRVIQNNVLYSKGHDAMLKESLLKTVSETADAVGNSAAAIGSSETKIGKGNLIVRRKRNTMLKVEKFARPKKKSKDENVIIKTDK